MRNKHETEAISLITQMRLDKSTIQVSGSSLTLQRKSAPAGLTWTYLEKEIPAWASRSGLSVVQGQSLLKWLQEHREIKETESLKKTPQGPKQATLQ
jgi:trans-aconitate methyltransferase